MLAERLHQIKRSARPATDALLNINCCNFSFHAKSFKKCKRLECMWLAVYILILALPSKHRFPCKERIHYHPCCNLQQT